MDFLAIGAILAVGTMALTQVVINLLKVEADWQKTALALPVSAAWVAAWYFKVYNIVATFLRLVVPDFPNLPGAPDVPEAFPVTSFLLATVFVWFYSIGVIKLGAFKNRKKVTK